MFHFISIDQQDFLSWFCYSTLKFFQFKSTLSEFAVHAHYVWIIIITSLSCWILSCMKCAFVKQIVFESSSIMSHGVSFRHYSVQRCDTRFYHRWHKFRTALWEVLNDHNIYARHVMHMKPITTNESRQFEVFASSAWTIRDNEYRFRILIWKDDTEMKPIIIDINPWFKG